MNTADKLLTQIKEDREIRAQATQGEWVEHRVVGDPEQIWILAGGKMLARAWGNGNNNRFIATAANTWERKNRQLEIAVEAINAARATFDAIYSFKPDDQIRTSAFGGSVELKQALEEMEAVK